MAGRQLRVLSWHPQLGDPGEVRDGFEGAQPFVDAGLAEWVVDRSAEVESTHVEPAVETATVRRTRQRGVGRGAGVAG